VASIIVGIRQAKQILPEGNVETGSKRAPLIFLLAVTAYLMVAWVNAMNITLMSDKIFPVTISSITLVCCLLLLIRMMRTPETNAVFADRESGGVDAEADHGLWGTLVWFGALLVMSALLGFILALAIFFVAFFRIRAGLSWLKVMLFSGAGIAFISAMAGTLNRDFPPGLLQDLVKLPWPLG
ncbi:MAG: tricarboxylate transporter, partial [Litoreibacter sp.]|nr:tricarboxylate transporter [Litoreibacter sp.]